ncbi:MAG: hypoxanthine phosphoribosyltransferase [Bacteroidaceae bacterium]|nr:hypoxanthine phosphoribosyltransferase [Bacteroidaceae bacterium]
MRSVKLKDKEFELFISEQQMQNEISRVAAEINRDFQGKEPLFLAVLNGSFMFASDLMKEVSIPSTISFVKMSSYVGTESTSTMKHLIGLNEDIAGRDVIVIEDIVDTGYTMKNLLEILNFKGPASVSVCSMLYKPNKLEVELDVRYVAMSIPDDFIVGYGLDYDGYGRNLRDIYKIINR